MKRFLLATLLCCVATVNILGQDVRAVTVTGSWGGLGTPAESRLTLRPSGDLFKGDGVSVKAELVKQLVGSTHEPALSKPSAANLGIDKEWLRAHIETAGKNASGLWFDQGTPAQKQFFTAKFMDESTLPFRLNAVYAGSHTDDYPSMKVAIELSNGQTIVVSSHSQNPLMLPWCVGTNSDCVTTFNAHISEALYAILPKKFADRERLHDDDNFGGLAPQMGLYMSGDLEAAWNRIGVRDKDPSSLQKIGQHFNVRYADINTWNDLAFNEVPNTGKRVDENLQVQLWREGFPKNFVVEAHLLREHGTTEGVEELPANANRYAEAVLSVGWLREFFRQHPQEHAFVTYVHGLSMTDKALRIFSADMKAIGHSNLIDVVKISQKDAALLETGIGDWWIVLPDHSMIMWRWGSLRPILKWPANTFDSKRCTDYQEVSGGCAGIVISPEGEIVR
jgi:hypothetical protein